MMTEEEMRQALFGSGGPVALPKTPPAQLPDIVNVPFAGSIKRKGANRFVPKLTVTLRVGNEFEGETELFTYESDTLSTLQAELDAKKIARKKFRYMELVSVKPAK